MSGSTTTSTRARLAIAGLALLVLGAVGVVAGPAAQAADGGCRSAEVPVTLPGQSDPSQTLHTELCGPADAKAVMLLVAGATYGTGYWDFPYEPERYSMVRAMNSAGIATLNVDRIGIGRSSHPLSTAITADSQADAMHQLVGKLRSGELRSAFEKVVIVGHSLGSAITELEAARFADVDGVIVTGVAHRLNPPGLAQLFATFGPAALESRFAGRGLDPGYLTTREDTRGGAFYYAPGTDPQVVAVDDATRETVTATELGSIAAPFVVPGAAAPVTVPACASGAPLCAGPLDSTVRGPASQIRVPSLTVLGQEDVLVCGPLGTDCTSPESVAAAEAPLWRPEACHRVRLVPDAGHDLNLHRNAPDWYATVADWTHALTAHEGAGCPEPVPGVA